jgi:hypothetical protein
MENLIVGLIVAIAAVWGVRGVFRSVRRVKKIGEQPPACESGSNGEQATAVASHCGCTSADTCQVSARCHAVKPRRETAPDPTEDSQPPDSVATPRRAN